MQIEKKKVEMKISEIETEKEEETEMQKERYDGSKNRTVR